MLSQAWIDAANKTDRQPVLYMSIESVKALKASIYDRAGWEAGPVSTNINTSSPQDDAGVVIMVTDGAEVHAGSYTLGAITAPIYYRAAGIDWQDTRPLPGTNNRVTQVVFNIAWMVYPGMMQGVTMQGSTDGGSTWQNLLYEQRSHNTTETFTIGLTKGNWTFRLAGSIGGSYTYAELVWYQTSYLTSYVPAAFTHTRSVDLGSVPGINSIVDISDHSSAIATLVYTARGSNDNATWTDLGTVVDGSSVAPFRYYDFTASFTSTGPETPILREIGVSGGNDQFRTYSTHEDTPVVGARPYLQASLSPLNAKLELMKLGSIGEVAPKLFFLRDTFELLRDGYLRNKLVQVRHGFLGMAAPDYEPIFTGLWYDGSIDYNAATINVKTRSIFSRFQKVQLPAEKAQGGARDDLTCPPWEAIDRNIITTMLDVVELMGIPDRYLDRPSFAALSGGVFDTADWAVNRRLDKDSKEDAIKLLEELSVLSGVFLLQQPDGKISAQLYDPSAAIQAEISTDIATFGVLELGQANLYTRQQLLFNPKHEGDLDNGVARGEWVIGRDYVVGGVVIDRSGRIFHCYSAHRSTAASRPCAGTAFRNYWIVQWAAGATYRDSVPDPYYPSDTERVVVHAGVIYTCLIGPNAYEPGATLGWATYWSAGASIAVPAHPWVWAVGTDFARSDITYKTDTLYRCLTSHLSSSTTEPASGESRRAYWATEWIAGTSYDIGDVIALEGPLFTCTLAHSAADTNKPGTGVDYRTCWYSAPVKKSSSDEDFYNAFVQINNLAEINWDLNADVPEGDPNYQLNPGYQKSWQEKWNATPYAREQLAGRMDAWFANPKQKIKASDLPPRFYGVGLGKMLGVTGLMLPSPGAVWGVPCDQKKFMVMSKTFDPAKCTVSFDLLEV